MTLVLAMHTADGIVLAADSRGTIGDPRGLTAMNDAQQKLSRLTDRVAVCNAGSAEVANSLLDGLDGPLAGTDGYVDEVLAAVIQKCKAEHATWFGGLPATDRPQVSLVIAGYRKVSDAGLVPMIYMLNSQQDFAPLLFGDAAPAMVGVPQYAVYLAHRYYDRSMNRDNGARLAEFLISETATQDPKVGGPIRIAIITPEDGYDELSREQVEALHERNVEQSARVRQFFFGGDDD